MRTIPYTHDKARGFVNKFCNHVAWLRRIRHTYKILFENDGSIELMNRAAPAFFGILQIMVSENVLLEFSKITDPSESNGSENFTVDNLIAAIDWPQDIRDRLTALRARTNDFRNHIKPARNKLLAHIDKKAFMAEIPLGKFPDGLDEVFLDALDEICSIAHEVCFGKILPQMIMAEPGDVISFKRALENAVAFSEYLSECSGEEKKKLHSYLARTRRR